MGEWLAIACERSVVRRALKTALIVGVILAAINHGDAIVAGALTAGAMLKIALTFLVPYCVSTSSSVAAISKARADR